MNCDRLNHAGTSVKTDVERINTRVVEWRGHWRASAKAVTEVPDYSIVFLPRTEAGGGASE